MKSIARNIPPLLAATLFLAMTSCQKEPTPAPTAAVTPTSTMTATPAISPTSSRTGIYLASFIYGYIDIIPPEWKARTESQARFRLVMEKSTKVINSCPYTGNHTLINTQLIITARLSDLVNTAWSVQKTFSGRDSGEFCPDKYLFDDPTATVQISEPDPREISLWINDTLVSLGFPATSAIRPDVTKTVSADGTPMQILKEQKGFISSVAYSPDGTLVVSGSQDKTAVVWDAKTSEILRVLVGGSGGVSDVQFSPDGKRLALGSFDDSVAVWDTEGWKRIPGFETGSSRSVAFSPDGKILVTGDYGISFWIAETGKALDPFDSPTALSVICMDFSPDGKILAVGTLDYYVWLINVNRRILMLKLKVGGYGVDSVAFSPDGKIIAAGYFARIDLFNVASGKKIGESLQGGCHLAFSTDGKLLAFGCLAGTVSIYDIEKGEIIRKMKGPGAGVGAIAFSPDGQTLVTGMGDGSVIFWDLRT